MTSSIKTKTTHQALPEIKPGGLKQKLQNEVRYVSTSHFFVEAPLGPWPLVGFGFGWGQGTAVVSKMAFPEVMHGLHD
jgi:hypothetical protein